MLRNAGFILANKSDGGEASATGCKHSDDSNIKHSMARKGKTASIETKLKQSAAKKGNKSCIGRVCSEDTRKKISASKAGKKLSQDHRLKLKGRKLSPEHAAKLLDGNALYWAMKKLEVA